MKRIIEWSLVFILLLVLAYTSKPHLAAFLNNKGVGCFKQDLYEEAISYFQKALKVESSSVLYSNLANVYMKLEDEDAAIKEYKNSIQTQPKNANVYSALGRIYLNRQMYKEALSLLKRAEAEFPAEAAIKGLHEEVYSGYILFCVNEGIEAYSAGDKAEAYLLLNKALKIGPNYIQPYYFLSRFYIADNNYVQAEELLKEVLQIKSDFLLARILLGDLYYKKGNYEKAISEYKSGLLIDSENSYLHNSLGLALMNIEDYSEAIVHLKNALEILPDNLNFNYSLASLYRDEGLLDKALVEYKKILEYLPGYLYIHNDLGDIYTQQGKKEEAMKEYYIEIENCRKKLEIIPDDINILNSIAYSYSAVGDNSKAKKIVEDIIKHHPSWRPAHLTLSRIEENLGNKIEALMALEEARSLSDYSGFIDKDITRLEKTTDLSFRKIALFDKIYLKNGRMIEGIILQETDEKIVLEIHAGKSWGTTIISQDRIKSISKNKDIKK